MFGRFRAARREAEIASRLYGATVAAARQPGLYSTIGVPDTLEGRFDMSILHTILTMARLDREGSEGKAIAQAVFDALFRDTDRALREMGVGDLTVPKRVRKMAEIFYGRLKAYGPGLAAGDAPMLAEPMGRNIFPDEPGTEAAFALARYAVTSAAGLAATSKNELYDGRLAFADPAAHRVERLLA